jgi:hypothetical protein
MTRRRSAITARAAARRRSRRGFAMPIVVALGIAATLVSLVLLERHANTHRAVVRQIDGYFEHHARLGIKEMLDQWLLTTGGNISDRLLEGGLAFELAFEGGRTVRVWLEDGQGSLLRQPSGSGRTVEAARFAAERIALALGEDPFAPRKPGQPKERHRDRRNRDDTIEEFDRPKLRDVGPLAVSALTADFDVLVAIAEAAGAGDSGTMIAGDIVSEREDGTLSAGDIAKACEHAGVSDTTKAIIAQLLTPNPTLWRLVAESDEGRWTGLVEQASRGSGLAGSGSSTLLEWERVAEHEQPE